MKVRAPKRKMSGIPDPCMKGCRLYYDGDAEANRVLLSRHVGRKPRGTQWKQCHDCKAWCQLGPRKEPEAKDRDHDATPSQGALVAFVDPTQNVARNMMQGHFTMSFTDESGVFHNLEVEDVQVTLPRRAGDDAVSRLSGRMKDPE